MTPDTQCSAAGTETAKNATATPDTVAAASAQPDSTGDAASDAPQAKLVAATPSVAGAVAPSSVSAPATIEASFDCAKAQSKTEKLICSTPEAAAADKQLSLAYVTARAKSADPDRLKAEQRQWIKDIRDQCADAACVTAAMDSRAERLKAL